MVIGSGAHRFNWIEDWAKIPDSETARGGWAHPGMATTDNDEIVTYHQGDPKLLFFDVNGNLTRTIDTGLLEGHGITVSTEADGEYYWVADTGAKRVRRGDELQATSNPGGQVVKIDANGKHVATIQAPDLEIYRANRFTPTAVAVFEERKGGNGDVWVADGYGQSHVHRYSRFDKQGNYLGSINGQEGAAGAFNSPHSIWIDYRKAEPEMYIADRTNKRIQVYDLDGHFKRVFGSDFLVWPSAFADLGDLLVCAELNARLALMDRDDKLVCYLGENPGIETTDGWPNMKDANGVATRTNRLEPGKLNSPHGVTTDSKGNIYVAEWLIGGRYVKLAKA